MPRAPGQSDFSVSPDGDPRAPADGEPDAQAGALATRWVMRATFVLLAALIALVAVGLHIPSGG